MNFRCALFFMILFPSGTSAVAQVEIRVDFVQKTDFLSTSRDADKLIENCDIVLTVINRKSATIKVPKDYWPRAVRLCSSSSRGPLQSLVLMPDSAAKSEKEFIQLAAGAKHQLLRVDATAILLNPGDIYSADDKTEVPKPRWTWGWGARLGADYSPFERLKGDDRIDRAVLWGEIDIAGQTIRSIPVQVSRTKHGG